MGASLRSRLGALLSLALGATLMIGTVANAEDTVRYAGKFHFEAGKVHKKAMEGEMQLLYKEVKKEEGSEVTYELTSIFFKSTEAVYGKKEFPSTEQTELNTSDDKGAYKALVFKLKGPTHKWYYVYVGTSKDEGKNFEGVFYRADNTLEDILKSLNAGEMPENWKKVGTGDVAVPKEE